MENHQRVFPNMFGDFFQSPYGFPVRCEGSWMIIPLSDLELGSPKPVMGLEGCSWSNHHFLGQDVFVSFLGHIKKKTSSKM